LRIAKSALQNDTHPEAKTGPKRLLLLLATQNADKAPKPAAFEQRLVMMEVFAEELLAQVGLGKAYSNTQEKQHDSDNGERDEKADEIQGIDIALTTEPYFVDKSNAIAEHPDYPASSTTQIRECLLPLTPSCTPSIRLPFSPRQAAVSRIPSSSSKPVLNMPQTLQALIP